MSLSRTVLPPSSSRSFKQLPTSSPASGPGAAEVTRAASRPVAESGGGFRSTRRGGRRRRMEQGAVCPASSLADSQAGLCVHSQCGQDLD